MKITICAISAGIIGMPIIAQDSELVRAATTGDCSRLAILLKLGETDNRGDALHAAAFAGQSEAVKLLISNGSPINPPVITGAIFRCNIESIELLLSKTKSLPRELYENLSFAKRKDIIPVCELLLRFGVRSNQQELMDTIYKERSGNTPNIGPYAASVIPYIIKSGVNPNPVINYVKSTDFRFPSPERPILLALMRSTPEVVVALLKAGANPNTEIKFEEIKNYMATEYAKTPEKSSILGAFLMVDQYSRSRPTYLPKVEALLAAGADPRIPNSSGISPIEFAEALPEPVRSQVKTLFAKHKP